MSALVVFHEHMSAALPCSFTARRYVRPDYLRKNARGQWLRYSIKKMLLLKSTIIQIYSYNKKIFAQHFPLSAIGMELTWELPINFSPFIWLSLWYLGRNAANVLLKIFGKFTFVPRILLFKIQKYFFNTFIGKRLWKKHAMYFLKIKLISIVYFLWFWKLCFSKIVFC